MIHRVIFRYKFIWGPKSQVSVFPLRWPHFKGTFEGCHKPQASLNNYCLESIFSCHQNPRKYRLFFFPQSSTKHLISPLLWWGYLLFPEPITMGKVQNVLIVINWSCPFEDICNFTSSGNTRVKNREDSP